METVWVLSRVMRKYNSVTYEVGKAKAEQAAGMFGLAAGQRAASCPSRVAKPLAKPLTGGWRSATYARSQQSVPCFPDPSVPAISCSCSVLRPTECQ